MVYIVHTYSVQGCIQRVTIQGVNKKHNDMGWIQMMEMKGYYWTNSD